MLFSVCFDAKKYSKGKRAFKLNRQKYKWFTIQEMKADRNIIRRNKDNVEYIEKTFILNRKIPLNYVFYHFFARIKV